MQVLWAGGEGKKSSTTRLDEGSRGESSPARVPICKEEPAALKLLVDGAEVEEGRDGSVAVCGGRRVAEGSCHCAVVRVNLMRQV